MTAEAIENFLNARSFRPFQLVTPSGESYTVPHPNFLHSSPTRRTCNVYGENGESFSTLDVFTITDIQQGCRRKALPAKSTIG
jgi:hypothetical protein